MTTKIETLLWKICSKDFFHFTWHFRLLYLVVFGQISLRSYAQFLHYMCPSLTHWNRYCLKAPSRLSGWQETKNYFFHNTHIFVNNIQRYNYLFNDFDFFEILFKGILFAYRGTLFAVHFQRCLDSRGSKDCHLKY